MKLRNKKTGEIADLSEGFIRDTYNGEMIQIKPVAVSNKEGYVYGSLAELNEEWEDAPEEPKDYWWISPVDTDVVHCIEDVKDEMDQYNKEIGNYFGTKEEVEKAAEKLKALNKLCRKGFEFHGVEMFGSGLIRIEASIPINEKTTLQERSDITDSLYLLFGGEE